MKKLRLDDLKHFPAIIAAPAMALGIVFNDSHPLPLWFLIPASLGSLSLITLLAISEKRKFIPLLAAIAAFCGGGATIAYSNSLFNPNPLGKPRQSNVKLTAEIDEIREINPDRISFTGYVHAMKYDSTWREKSGHKKIRRTLTRELGFNRPVKLIFEVKEPPPRLYHSLMQQLEPGKNISLSGGYNLPLNKRNPGGFDYAGYLKRQNIPASVYVYSDSTIKISGSRYPIQGEIYSIRRSIAEMIDSLHDKKTAAILKGLIIADRASIDESTVNNYIDTGIAHILAVSGFNVGVIYLLTLLFFQKLKPVSRNGELVARLIILFLFLVITQFQITVVRAVLMFTVHSLLKYSGRDPNGWNTLSLTAILLLLFDPQDLFSTSFQLSVAAVAGLFIAEAIKTGLLKNLYACITGMTSSLKGSLESISRSWLFRSGFEMVIVTLFVQIFMLPFLAGYFGKVTMLSIPANLAGVPLSSFMLINGILTLFLALFSTQVASLAAAASTVANSLIDSVVTALNNTGWGKIEIVNTPVFEVVVFYLLIVVALILIAAKKNLFWRTVVVTVTGVVIVFSHFLLQEPILQRGKAYLIAIDVGQGDSYLLRNSNGETWLIDAGPVSPRFDPGEKTIPPLLKKLGIDSISLALISHYDLDHAGGMLSLARAGIVKRLAIPPPDSSDDTDISLYNLFTRFGDPEILRDSSRFTSGDLDLLVHLDHISQGASSNSRSAVYMASLAGRKILFTGDLDKKGEKALTGKKLNLDCDLLKVSHHGSGSGTSAEFLAVALPEVAIISAGLGNRFRHPNSEVLDRLEDGGAAILRTDLDGCLIIEIDSETIKQIDWR